MRSQYLGQPDGETRLGDYLETQLGDPKWTTFRAAVAFVKQSGVNHIRSVLTAFCARGNTCISVGISFGGTSLDGLSLLYEAVGNNGEIWVFHNANGSTFHPKLYLFKSNNEAQVAIGSGNLTTGGLYTNYEASIVLTLDLSDTDDRELLDEIEAELDKWSLPDAGTALKLDENLLDELAIQGYLPPEVYSRETEEVDPSSPSEAADDDLPLFAVVPVPAPPVRKPSTPQAITIPSRAGKVFQMTLQKTDVGVGQTTPGTSRRSPEIFIPLTARDANPTFWDWPTAFVPDTTKPGKMDRMDVQVLLGGNIETVNMMTWPDKHDFRLRCEAMRSGGRVGDILRMERTAGNAGYLYVVQVIPQGTSQYATAIAQCVNAVRNSSKVWGYV